MLGDKLRCTLNKSSTNKGTCLWLRLLKQEDKEKFWEN